MVFIIPIAERANIQNIKKLKKLDTNNPIKNRYKAKQSILNRRISYGQETLKGLNVLSHLENENQND